ncbi:MAG: polynucleotide 5'-hydroxyl-kinase [Actinobacteria bacterium]|nr:polynucleotide 5'-hydroxyl-kinase [Actinomycetota bacterium]
MDAYDTVVARIVERGGMALALGALDSGKTSFCTMCAAVAVRLGKTVAYIDTDIGQTTVGPPAAIGLKYIARPEDVEPDALARADTLAFVGSMSPQGHMLPMVVGAVKLADQARAEGVDLIMVDTTGFISGMSAEMLKFHKIEALAPDVVVGFQRGGELEPILGAVRRALPPEVESLPVAPSVIPRTVDDRSRRRQARLAAIFEPPVHRWKVKPSVLVPPVPPEIDLSLLDGLLVGMEDGKGNCVGLGILEWHEDGLRMISALAEGAKALRLGALRVGPDFQTTNVDLRNVFLSD